MVHHGWIESSLCKVKKEKKLFELPCKVSHRPLFPWISLHDFFSLHSPEAFTRLYLGHSNQATLEEERAGDIFAYSIVLVKS